MVIAPAVKAPATPPMSARLICVGEIDFDNRRLDQHLALGDLSNRVDVLLDQRVLLLRRQHAHGACGSVHHDVVGDIARQRHRRHCAESGGEELRCASSGSARGFRLRKPFFACRALRLGDLGLAFGGDILAAGGGDYAANVVAERVPEIVIGHRAHGRARRIGLARSARGCAARAWCAGGAGLYLP
jgi:hypothetical protein